MEGRRDAWAGGSVRDGGVALARLGLETRRREAVARLWQLLGENNVRKVEKSWVPPGWSAGRCVLRSVPDSPQIFLYIFLFKIRQVRMYVGGRVRSVVDITTGKEHRSDGSGST